VARFRLTVEVRPAPAAAPAARRVRRPAAAPGRPARRGWAFPPRLALIALLLLVTLATVGTWNYFRPVPAVAATSFRPAQTSIAGSAPALPWPGVGSAAVGAAGLGLIATSGDVAPAPAASVAKVMTALVLLEDEPLALGDDGPALVMTALDVATYVRDAAEQQSVVPVAAGEKLSEYQALEALLIPSGNNIAETLARWDAGSVDAFVTKMNQRAAALHLTRTTFADPAGVSTQTVSTPADLVELGIAAMQKEVLAQIVGLPQAVLPVAGTVYNVNSALGQSGIIGIKTGSGLNLGANFLFAASATAGGRPVTILGCVMGQPTLEAAFSEAIALVDAMQPALSVSKVIARYDVAGDYEAPWGGHSDLVATTDVMLVAWPGMVLRQRLDVPAVAVDATVPNGASEGKLHIVLGDQQVDVPLVTGGSLDPPGFWWRATRINI
jgi:D-alanyl-D-alanine carboxypeptidase (penicillin-binding protein 5/6)